MSRELYAFRTRQNIDAGPVEGRAKRVGMQRLAPLVVRLFVAMSAVLSLGKSAGLNEIVGIGASVTWKCEVVLAEAKIVSLANFFGVVCAVECAVGLNAGAEVHRSQERRCARREANNDAG